MNFEAQARYHQEKYRKEVLKLSSYDVYPTMLTDEDAWCGHNFCLCISGVLEAVLERYGDSKGPLFKNMLRSEHIPFNLFAPFLKSCNDPLVLAFYQALFPVLAIEKLASIEIEKTPQGNVASSKSGTSHLFGDNETYLDDRTSFDVLITYESKGEMGAIGIEVKYTEKSYPYGETERQRMFSATGDSLYHKTHEASGIYLPDTIPFLREKKLKQLWRNHLLGLKMIQKEDVASFTSVHMYPSGNTYQEQAACEYFSMLRGEHQNTFFRLTYEDFVCVAKEVLSKNEKWKPWIQYIEERYIF